VLGKATKKQLRKQGPLETALRETIRTQGNSDNTADCYWEWIEKYLRWHAKRASRWIDPKEMGKMEVEAYLTWLANEQRVSASTQNQAFSALCFLYRWIIKKPLEDVSALRSKIGSRVREVVDESELVAMFAELSGVALLCARMMYASNFRIGELGKLRMKDISFARQQITIHAAKGKKDRIVQFPPILHDAVRRQMESIRVLWKHDLEDGRNGVSLPDAFGRKSPNSHTEFAWYYLFSADQYSKCPHTGRLLRHHRDMDNIGRQIKNSAIKSGCSKRITSHCLRHSYATHSLENGVPVHVVQQLMGHSSLEVTQTYLHVTKTGITSAESPLSKLERDAERAEETRPATPLANVLSTPIGKVFSDKKALTPSLRLFVG
jgi:integron integrase